MNTPEAYSKELKNHRYAIAICAIGGLAGVVLQPSLWVEYLFAATWSYFAFIFFFLAYLAVRHGVIEFTFGTYSKLETPLHYYSGIVFCIIGGTMFVLTASR